MESKDNKKTTVAHDNEYKINTCWMGNNNPSMLLLVSICGKFDSLILNDIKEIILIFISCNLI